MQISVYRDWLKCPTTTQTVVFQVANQTASYCMTKTKQNNSPPPLNKQLATMNTVSDRMNDVKSSGYHYTCFKKKKKSGKCYNAPHGART